MSGEIIATNKKLIDFAYRNTVLTHTHTHTNNESSVKNRRCVRSISLTCKYSIQSKWMKLQSSRFSLIVLFTVIVFKSLVFLLLVPLDMLNEIISISFFVEFSFFSKIFPNIHFSNSLVGRFGV